MKEMLLALIGNNQQHFYDPRLRRPRAPHPIGRDPTIV